jgi:hypothetical protein
MKSIIAILTFLFLGGLAGAVLWGPPAGFENPGTVTVGDLVVTNNLAVGGTTIDNGAISDDTTWAAGKDIKAASGSGEIDWHLATGTTKTTTGTNTLYGDVVITGAKTFTSGTGQNKFLGNVEIPGTKTFEMGTGAASFGGAVTVASLTSNATVVATTQVKGADLWATDDALIGDDFFVDGTATVNNLVSNTTITATNTVQGEHLYSTDDASINDDLAVDGGARVDETLTVNAVAVNTTLGVTGLTTLKNIAVAVNATTTLDTTLTSANTSTIYGIDASGGSVTLTLPAANTVTGRLYMIGTAADMVLNNIVIATTGGGKLGGAGGADTLTSTDAAAGLQVVSDGTNYLVVAKVGTWT